MKTYHEWGYHFNETREIGELTNSQKRVIGLAERAESYLQEEARNRSQQGANSSVNTKSNLENRASKRKRIQEAKT